MLVVLLLAVIAGNGIAAIKSVIHEAAPNVPTAWSAKGTIPQAAKDRMGDDTAPSSGQTNLTGLPGARSAGDSGSRPSDAKGPNGAVDSTINIIAATIGILTLVVTLGTGWFIAHQERLSKIIAEVERLHERTVAAEASRRQVAERLIDARAELIGVLGDGFGQNPDSAFRAMEVIAFIEGFQSSSEAVRRRSYQRTVQYMGPKMRGVLPHTWDYCRLCEGNVPQGQKAWCNPFGQ